MRLNLNPRTWQSFLNEIIKPNNYAESCAWLFCDKPFCDDHTIFVFQVKNVGLKGHTIFDSFQPDKKDFQQVKRMARNLKLTRVGNVHTHIVTQEDLRFIEDMRLPSKPDLKFARKYNDIIRGVVTVFFPERGKEGQIFSVVWTDQYGKILKEARSS